MDLFCCFPINVRHLGLINMINSHTANTQKSCDFQNDMKSVFPKLTQSTFGGAYTSEY